MSEDDLLHPLAAEDSLTSVLNSSSTSNNNNNNTIIKVESEVCYGCREVITDKYLLKVNGRSWHATCLRCYVCQSSLDRQPSCFIKDDTIYCKADYARTFGAKCAKCGRSISATDWVRRAKDQVYHLACFACDACKRQLSTGEEFALYDNRVLCKTHYQELVDGGRSSNEETADGEGSQQKTKTKRVRTTFTDEQLQVLQANFQLDSNPDGQDLERIAQITGLSKRVTQVWFQNSRARQKKHLAQAKQKQHQHHQQQHQQQQQQQQLQNNVSYPLEKSSGTSQQQQQQSQQQQQQQQQHHHPHLHHHHPHHHHHLPESGLDTNPLTMLYSFG